MWVPRPLPALLVTVALAASPAAALAQGGAGDDQYADPFGGSGQGSGQGSGGGSGSSGSGDSQRPGLSERPQQPAPAGAGPAPSAAPAQSAPTTPQPAAAPTQQAQQELPRTGLDAGVVALIGSGLLVAGVGLRMRLRTLDERRG